MSISEASSSSVRLEGEVNPEGNPTRYHFEYGAERCSQIPDPCTSLPEVLIPAGTSPVPVSFPLGGLPAGTGYHVRLVAKSSGGTKAGPEGVFATYSEPLAGLPDGRAYEQSSPVDKNGGDASGIQALVKATPLGDGVTFASTFGFPGEVGAQTRSIYLGSRGADSWSTRGLLPPESVGESARVIGWLPDFSQAYSMATKFTKPRIEAMIAEPSAGGPPVQMSDYVPEAHYAYAGATQGGAIVFFEAEAKLPPKPGKAPIAAAVQGAPNLYAWDRESGEVHLVSVMNDESSPPLGGMAGPYDWALGGSSLNLRLGGGARNYYLQDSHAVRPDGSIYFTAAGTGQLYLRENPTASQSPLNGEGECQDPAKACTIHVSATRRTPPDSGGAQPAAFQAASADGSKVFFTSSEMLTEDANTGPEQPLASIVRDTIDGNPANIEEDFIPKRAVGLAEDSEYIYWADPIDGTIGRAKLDGSEPPDDGFIVPGPVGCGKEIEPGVFENEAPSAPRYVAVDAEHVYWTNSGCLKNGEPELGGGSIGRATIEGEDVESEFIPGKAEPEPGKVVRQVSDPQGIAVSASHIYWANAPENETVDRAIARSAIGGGTAEPRFWETEAKFRPFGIVIGGGHLYYGEDDELNGNGLIARIDLEGGEEKSLFVGETVVRGVAVDAAHVYWASQGEAAIGRAGVGDFEPGECETTIPGCAKKFIPISSVPNGVTADTEHLYWSVNGETSPNPGNDLYRFEPQNAALTDLTPLTPEPGQEDGAEVLGVLGASADGSYLYFTANGDLDGTGPAQPGNCHSSVLQGPLSDLSGHCNIYLYHEGVNHEGTISFVARVHAGGGEALSDAFDWAPTPIGIGGGNQYLPRTAQLGDGGQALLFRSQDSLTDYQANGVPEYYLYRAGEGTITCLTCKPSGEAPGEGPQLGRITFPPGVAPPSEIEAVLSRNLSEDASRFFFETSEALSPADTNGGSACEVPLSEKHQYPSCEDVYEWEAPGAGSCEEGGPSYAPLSGGCIYLVSSGKSTYPSLFGDASESGEDVFFFTRQSLVGQDEDELQDVYDARVKGGLPSQFPPRPEPCESIEACHGPEQGAASEETPGSSSFQGPPDPKPKRKKHSKAKRHHKKHHKHHHRGQQKQAKGRASR